MRFHFVAAVISLALVFVLNGCGEQNNGSQLSASDAAYIQALRMQSTATSTTSTVTITSSSTVTYTTTSTSH